MQPNTIDIPKQDLLNIIGAPESELIWSEDLDPGHLRAFVIPYNGKHYKVIVESHPAEGLILDDFTSAIEVQSEMQLVKAWVEVDSSLTQDSALAKVIADNEKLSNLFKQGSQTTFKQVTTLFFEKNPAIKSIVWEQYSPYWNDGEECVFSVHEPAFTTAEGEETDYIHYGAYNGDDNTVFTYNNYSIKNQPLIEGVDKASIITLSDALQSDYFEDVLLSMFGNHVKIVATREGFSVTEYDHD